VATSPRLHILYGPDAFSAREAVRSLREDLAVSESNVVRLEGRTTPVSEIAAAAHTATFFAEPRLVIIEGLSERFAGRRRSGARQGRARNAAQASDLDKVVEVLSDLPDTTTVVLFEGQPTPGFLEAFKSVATISQFLTKRGDEIRRWAEARFKERGGSITAAAIERLYGRKATPAPTAAEHDRAAIPSDTFGPGDAQGGTLGAPDRGALGDHTSVSPR
jgi:DNA polymerase III delta subunit